MSSSTQDGPATRHKAFEYSTGVTWSEGRRGVVASAGKPDIPVASPPEFRGVPGVWTPEDFYVAAIEACQMTTFLSFASRAGLVLKRYASSAAGRLEFQNGGYQFTSVTLHVRIAVGSEQDATRARDLMDQAHHACLIGRSCCTQISVVSDISIEP